MILSMGDSDFNVKCEARRDQPSRPIIYPRGENQPDF